MQSECRSLFLKKNPSGGRIEQAYLGSLDLVLSTDNTTKKKKKGKEAGVLKQNKKSKLSVKYLNVYKNKKQI